MSHTTQETFGIVVAHLRKQGHAAVGTNGQCLYRAPNGDTCAIGYLIPDEVYEREIENTPFRLLPQWIQAHLHAEHPGLYLKYNDVALGAHLQEAHDRMQDEPYGRRELEPRLAHTARLAGLTYTEPT